MIQTSFCPCCGHAEDTLYAMIPHADGSFSERVDGSPIQPTDCLACYGCCDRLEGAAK